MAKILVVDDNREWREGLSELLTDCGHTVALASDGEKAIRLLDKAAFDLIISDLLMPGIDGFQLCRYVRDSKALPNIPFIFCSGFFPIKEQKELSDMLAVEDFFDKPVDFDLLLAAVERNLGRAAHSSEEEVGEERNNLSFSKAHSELVHSKLWSAVERERKHREIAEELAASMKKNLEAFIAAVSKAVEARDPYTAGHQRRVGKLACAIAREMHLSDEQITGIHFGSLIHDIGKIHIPAEILAKPSRLTPIEFEMVKSHAEVGYQILQDIDFPWPIAEVAYQHHERINGSGYPQGLQGDEIIIEARIVAVADVVEAMSSHRPYRPGLGIDAATEEIAKNRAVFYDPDAVDACLALIGGFTFDEPGKRRSVS